MKLPQTALLSETDRTPRKVFGIGFHKTGTTSLARALELLGYHVTGPNGQHTADIAHTYRDLTRRLSRECNAFQDNPWPLVFAEMDEMWPEAKFVLTLRDPESWITSLVNHFGTQATPMRELIYGQGYGAPVGHEAHYLTTYAAHNEAVRAHFRDRPDKLLEMKIGRGVSWEPLCDFLGHPVPDVPFPHANSAADRQRAARLPHRLPHRVARKVAAWF